MKKTLFTLILLAISVKLFAFESPFEFSHDDAKIRMQLGGEITTDIILRVPEGHFLYKDKTELSFTTLEGIHVRSIIYPKGVPHKDPMNGGNITIFPEGESVISVVFSAPLELQLGKKEVTAVLEMQGCEERLCLRPERHVITWKLDVAAAGSELTEDKPEIETWKLNIKQLLNFKDFKDVVSRGRYIALIVALVAGLLTSMTPCVWPLIPVLLLIIGIHKKGHVLGNLLLSFSLVAGIAVTYSVLGVLAVAAGNQISFLFQEKIFVILLIAVLLMMSLSMFGLFTIQLPQSVQKVLTHLGGKGYRGAFLSGMSLGLMATPCVGPVLGPMLLWVASQKAYAFGVELLAAYALGMGAVYIIAGTFYGTFAERLKHVKAGGIVKKIIGALLLIPALYYLNSIIPFNLNGDNISWLENEQAALVESAATKRPMLIIFGARWCPPCVKLESMMANDENIAEIMKGFVVLHVDATNDSPEINRILDKYNVVGWPTILFVSSGGKMYDDLRIVGEVPETEELIRTMKEALKR